MIRIPDNRIRGQKNPPNMFTVDHVIPVSRRGTSRKENLVGACFRCNQARGSKMKPGAFHTPFEEALKGYGDDTG